VSVCLSHPVTGTPGISHRSGCGSSVCLSVCVSMCHLCPSVRPSVGDIPVSPSPRW
jgi:hypothetical protein